MSKEEEARVMRNNKLLIETVTSQMTKLMNDNMDSLRQELQQVFAQKHSRSSRRDQEKHEQIPQQKEARPRRPQEKPNWRSRSASDKANQDYYSHDVQRSFKQTKPLQNQLSTRIDYEEVYKNVLEAFKAVEKSKKKNSSTAKSDGSKTAKEKPSCLEKEMVIQNLESDQLSPIHKELIVLEENPENSNKEKVETQLCNADQNQQYLSRKEQQTENKSLNHLTSLQAKCTFSSIQSDFVFDKLTHSEPVQPSSIISSLQILEEKYPKEAQRSLPLINELEQPTSLVPKHFRMSFPHDYPRKHCKEFDLVKTKPNLFVMVSTLDEKRFGLENVKEFCVSKSVFDKIIPTFETLKLKKFFKPRGFPFDEFREFNSSLRVSLCNNAFELSRTEIEYALVKTFSEWKNMLCESNLLNVLRNPTLKDHVFELSTSSIMHLFCPMSVQKGTGDLEKHKHIREMAIKEKPPDLFQPQTNLMITKKTQKGSCLQKPKLPFVFKETLMSLTNPEHAIPSKIQCLLQEFEENNPGGLPSFFGLEHQFIDESGALSKTFLSLIQSKQGKKHVVSNAMTQRYEFLAIPNARLLDFEHSKVSYDSIDRFTYEKFFKTKSFMVDKIKQFELKCFLNDYVLVFDNLSKIAYYISYVKTKEGFSVSNPFTKGFDILVYNQILDYHVESFTFCTYDFVSRVFVVKTQVMQSEGVKSHAPETWLFSLWLMRFTVQVDYDPRKHLRNKQEKWQANKRQCRMVFEPGGCLRIQIKCFPNHKKIHLMPRIDGPFNTTKLISNDSYLHILKGKCNVSSNFKVSNLVLFIAEDSDLRSNPFQVGEDDAIMESTKDLKRVKQLVAEEEHGTKEQLGAEEYNEPENELITEKEYGKDVILTSLVLIHDRQMGMCLICTLFPLSSFVPMGFLDKVFNEANDSHPNHPFDDQDWTRTFKKPSQGLAIKSSLF